MPSFGPISSRPIDALPRRAVAAFTEAAGRAGDPADALLHFDGADASTTISDECGSTWTAVGNARLDTGVTPKFGTASLQLITGTGGTNDYVTTANSSRWTLSSNDFTIDFWFRCEDNSDTKRLAGHNSVGTSFLIERQFPALTIKAQLKQAAVGIPVTGTTQFSSVVNTGWHHLAFVRTGNTLKLFLDGVQEGGDVAFSGVADTPTSNLSVGQFGTGTSNCWAGFVDEFRFLNGTAAWTSNFTPPTGAYSLGGRGTAAATSTVTAASTGAAAGTGAAAATSIAITARAGAAAGTGAAAGIGTATAAAIGSAAGTGAAAGIADAGTATGSAAGSGAAAGVSTVTAASAGLAAGTGAAAAISIAITARAGAAAGTGAAAGIGAATAAATGSAAGIGAAAGIADAGTATGSASGTGAATGIGAATAATTGSAAGTGAASATATVTAASAGTAAGTGAAAGISEAGTATGSAAGTGAAAATGRAIATSTGSAAGAGAASATATATTAAVGSAAGTGVAAAVGQSVAAGSVGAASGIGTAAGVSTVTAAAAGSASGTGTAIGVIVDRAAPVGGGGVGGFGGFYWVDEWKRLARRLEQRDRPAPETIPEEGEPVALVPYAPRKPFKVSPSVVSALAQAETVDDIRELAQGETGQVRNMLNTLVAEHNRRMRDEDDLEVILLAMS